MQKSRTGGVSVDEIRDDFGFRVQLLSFIQMLPKYELRAYVTDKKGGLPGHPLLGCYFHLK